MVCAGRNVQGGVCRGGVCVGLWSSVNREEGSKVHVCAKMEANVHLRST